VVEPLSDPRRKDPPLVGSERDLLVAWLEFHRTTLLLKCDGLDGDGRAARPVPTSKLSLHGLVRHMAEVERNWFRRVLLTQPETPPLYTARGGEEPDPDLVLPDDADFETDVATWEAECEHSRQVIEAHGLDDRGLAGGRPVSLRWICLHMLEEYARHNGHADLLRELVDGAVGD
jgi:hypothetical protein